MPPSAISTTRFLTFLMSSCDSVVPLLWRLLLVKYRKNRRIRQTFLLMTNVWIVVNQWCFSYSLPLASDELPPMSVLKFSAEYRNFQVVERRCCLYRSLEVILLTNVRIGSVLCLCNFRMLEGTSLKDPGWFFSRITVLCVPLFCYVFR